MFKNQAFWVSITTKNGIVFLPGNNMAFTNTIKSKWLTNLPSESSRSETSWDLEFPDWWLVSTLRSQAFSNWRQYGDSNCLSVKDWKKTRIDSFDELLELWYTNLFIFQMVLEKQISLKGRRHRYSVNNACRVLIN